MDSHYSAHQCPDWEGVHDGCQAAFRRCRRSPWNLFSRISARLRRAQLQQQ